MCARYLTPEEAEIERFWHIGRRNPMRWWEPAVRPLSIAPFLRPRSGGIELVLGQWGLIPPWSGSRIARTPTGARMSTNNARLERVATAPTYRDAWRKGQRCIIPASSYDEPNWTSGRNVWKFARADGAPWALAGIWSEWLDHETGEVVPSYTMLTQNCDGHPLLAQMHKPDPALPPDKQDKRCPCPLEPDQWDAYLGLAAQLRPQTPDLSPCRSRSTAPR